jgi:hypothetical protein
VKCPWTFDNLLAEDKLVLVKSERHSRGYRIEEIKEMSDLGDY